MTREPGDELQGFPELVGEGPRDGDAGALLSSAVRVPLDERVKDRLVAETRGNPPALLELPRGLTPAELAGGFGLLDAPGLSGRIEDSFRVSSILMIRVDRHPRPNSSTGRGSRVIRRR